MENLAKQRCVVLGAGGFIGTNLCRALVHKVKRLRAFGRQNHFPDAMRNIQWIQGDFNDPAAVAAAIEGCDIVFHLVTATTPSTSNIDKIADLQSNVRSSLQLLDACRSGAVRRVVFVSSGGTVYGVPGSTPIPETAATNPITAYGVSKLAIEKYCALYEHLYGLQHRVLRVANPYGPFQTTSKNQGVIAAFMRSFLDKTPLEIWGDGSVIRDYIYIDDVISALEKAAVHEGQHRIFNIASNEGRSLNEIAAEIQLVFGRKTDVNYFPSRPIDVHCNVLDTRLAEQELVWQPTVNFHEGLIRTKVWLDQIPR